MKNVIFTLLIFLIYPVTAQNIFINELMPSNTYTLSDEDGDYPDWFEIYNNSDQSVHLKNWTVSDDLNEPGKWIIPDIWMAGGEYLLLFASDKDKKNLVGHWETIIDKGNLWKYHIGAAEVPDNWRHSDFDDSSWPTGASGFGYGDGDDNTIITNAMSIFIRKQFTIDSLEDIANAILHVDYDDAFVAYLNGVEIARGNIGTPGVPPAWNEPADNYEHEAQMYSGGLPEAFYFDSLISLLRQGENYLAMEVHNYNTGSSDLSLIPFFTLGLKKVPEQPNGSPPILGLKPTVMHTNFKLTAAGEMIVLSDSTGKLVDSLSFPQISSDISYGRLPDGGNHLVYFENPTPGSKNDSLGYPSVAGEIIFSNPGGLISQSISLELSVADLNSVIYYTLDGSEPNEDSPVYNGEPITIQSTTVVRARALGENLLPGKISTHSYLFRSAGNLPVISLTTDPYNLWDNDVGIYVLGDSYENVNPYFGANFWEDWEIPVHLEYFDETGNPGFHLDAGTKIQGGWGRARPQKSMSILARGRYGYPEIIYQVFKNRSINKFNSLILRNSANDWDRTKFADGMMQGLVEPLDLEVQAFQPCIVYLNGEYWGILNIREKMNEDYLASYFDIDPDNIDLLENNGGVIEGDDEHYKHLLDFLETNNIADVENYAYVKTLINIDNYLDYQAVQIYIDNRDWPGNNIKYWRSKEEGGRWRWLLFDTDFGFGINGYNSGNAYEYNTLNFATSPTQQTWANPPWATFMLRTLLENEEFRNDFANRFADHMNTIFKPELVTKQIDSLANMLEDEMYQNYLMWSQDHWWSPERLWWNNFNPWYDYVQIFRDFAVNRPLHMKLHLLNKFDISGIMVVTLDVSPASAGWIKISTVQPNHYPWTGSYFNNIPVKIQAIPAPGYVFTNWSGASGSTDANIIINSQNSASLTANFNEQATDGELVINEINYHSAPNADAGDWVEIYNSGSIPWNLSGLFFSDSDPLHKFQFAGGLMLDANQYLVLCRDTLKFKDQFPEVYNYIGNFDFGLSSNGESIVLRGSGGELIDSVSYGVSSPWPDTPDGYGPTLELLNPGRDNTNYQNWAAGVVHGTPGRQNSVYTAIEEPEPNTANRFLLKQNYPNPFNGTTTLEFNLPSSQEIVLQVFDITGRRIRTLVKGILPAGGYKKVWDGNNEAGQQVSSGIYYAVLKGYDIHFTRKMIYLK